MMHKNVEIRAKWENVQMKGRNLRLGVGVGYMMKEGYVGRYRRCSAHYFPKMINKD